MEGNFEVIKCVCVCVCVCGEGGEGGGGGGQATKGWDHFYGGS